MNKMKQFISYDGLPINSGGAHSINSKSIEENYEKTLTFLEKFTDTKEPKSIQLSLYKSENKEYSINKLFIIFTLKFGIPKKVDGVLKSWNWVLSNNDIEKGFKMLKLNKNLPKTHQGPITLSFTWNFKFKNSKTNEILSNQDKIPTLDSRDSCSRIYLRNSNKSSISVWFALPFEKLEEFEIEYINDLKSSLPFKPSEKHWKIWKKSIKGNWISRKF